MEEQTTTPLVEKTERETVKEIEQLIANKPLDKAYLILRYKIPENSIQEYHIKRKLLEIGKELLPSDLEEGQNDVDVLYQCVNDVLKKEIPSKRQIRYDYTDQGGKRYVVYKLSSNDASECHAEVEKFERVQHDFREQQHEQHLGELQDMDNQIFHELVKHNIIKKQDPSFEEKMDELLKDNINDLF